MAKEKGHDDWIEGNDMRYYEKDVDAMLGLLPYGMIALIVVSYIPVSLWERSLDETRNERRETRNLLARAKDEAENKTKKLHPAEKPPEFGVRPKSEPHGFKPATFRPPRRLVKDFAMQAAAKATQSPLNAARR